jgi:RimJ/RimL family protein N-acetyltransferase
MSEPMVVRPLTLEGEVVRLEPLSFDHLDGLTEVGLAPDLWRWMPERIETRGQMRAFVEAALRAQGHGDQVPFAILEQGPERVIGSTRYLSIVPDHRRLEIGYTWVAPAWQRTAVNTECKLLLLAHAFDELGARRVEFKTDSLNEPSRAALRGIGAVEEGTMRNHMISQGGRIRHSVYYSIIDSEWPAVRAALEARLGRAAVPQLRP